MGLGADMSAFMDGVNKWAIDNPLGAKVLEQQSRIEQLERELAECHAERSEWMQAIEQANKNGQQYEALQSELAAEKAMADDIYEGSLGEFCSDEAYCRYRKARGL